MTARTKWSVLGMVAATLVAIGLVWPAMRRSNCGGNSAALAACKGYAAVVELWATDHAGQSFVIGQADAQTRQQLGHLPGASWIRSSRLLARPDGVRIGVSGNRQIILVCDRPYQNVPQRVFGKSPPAHAVVYSTGETGLISPSEFARLELKGFVDLQALAETAANQVGTAGGNPPLRADGLSTSRVPDGGR